MAQTAGALTEAAGASFFDAALAAFDRAREPGAPTVHVSAGPAAARFHFATAALADALLPAWSHLLIPEREPPALTVHLFTNDHPATAMPPPPWTNDRYWTRGRILGFSEGRFRFHYEPGVDILTAYDRDLRRGLYWLPKLAYLPWWERSFPMRLLMHFWSAATPLQPLHAGAAGLPDGGVLIAGLSGSGKSTTTLACLDSDLLYAGDDYIAADCETPHAYSLYNAAKVEADNLDRLPFLRPLLANPGGLANGEKAMTFLVRHCPAKLTAGFPLRAILLPKVTGLRDTTIVPARPMDALAAIAPTTILHLAEDSALIMRKVSKLVRALPVYRLNAGVDLPQIPAAILRLLRG